MEEARRMFIPAAGRDWALPLYDPLVRVIGGDRARRALLELAPPEPGQILLDVGCGTGGLALLAKRLHPSVEVIGLDPDPRALARASHKAVRSSLQVRFERGFADALPYPGASFDRVSSCFVYHHLERDEREAMFKEARRVLRPGGMLGLLDFDGAEDRILASMARAGFVNSRKAGRGSVAFGLLGYSCFLGSVPPAEASRVR